MLSEAPDTEATYHTAEVTHQEAERALDDAAWIASQLANVPEWEFKSLPLTHRRQR